MLHADPGTTPYFAVEVIMGEKLNGFVELPCFRYAV